MKLDTPKLTEAITLCFEQSMNTDLPETERARFLFQGKQLRGQLLNVLTAQFDAELDPDVTEANRELADVVTELKKGVDDIAKARQRITELRGITKLIDGLIQGAASFV